MDANNTTSGITANSITIEDGAITTSTTNAGSLVGPLLTLGSGGITIATTAAGASSFNSNTSVGLSASQSWTNNLVGNTFTHSGTLVSTAASGTQTLTATGVGSFTLAGAVTNGSTGGTLAPAKTGSGTLTLSSASNTFSGGLTITGGTVSISNNQHLGGAGGTAGAVALNGGTLQFTASVTNTHVITVNPNIGGTLRVTGSNLSSLGSTSTFLTGSGNLIATSTGTISNFASLTNNSRLTFAANYSGFTGGLTIQNGLIAEVGTGLAAITGGTVTVGANGILAFNNGTFSQALTVNDGGILLFNAATPTLNGGITVNGTAEVRLQHWFENVIQSGTISGLTGTGGLKVDSGSNTGATLTLAGTNTFAGNSTILDSTVAITGNSTSVSGTWNVTSTGVVGGAGVNSIRQNATSFLTLNGNTGSLASNAKVTLNGGTFNYQGATAGSALDASGYTFSGGDRNYRVTYGTSGNTSLNLANATRTAGTTNNYTVTNGTNGTTNKITFSSAPSTGVLIDKGDYFAGTSYAAYDTGGFVRAYGSGDTDYVAQGASATGFTGTSTTSNVDVTGAVTNQTNTQINTLRLGTTNGVTMTAGHTLTVDGILKSGGNAAVITGGTGIQASSGGELVIRTNATGDSLTISTAILNNGGSSLTKSGLGTLTLSNANGYAGGTTINAGTVSFANNTSFGVGAITSNGGTIISSAGVTTTNNLTVNSATVLDVTGGNWNLNGNISGSGDIIRAAGANLSLFLGGDNSGYSGTFTVINTANAVVRLASVNAGSANARWVVNQPTSTRFSLNVAGTYQFGSLTGTGFVTNQAAAAAVIQVGNLGLNETFGGVLEGNGASPLAVTKVGTGAWTLLGGNSYSGTTTIENGALVAGRDAPSGAAGAFGNATSAIALGNANSITNNNSVSLLLDGGVTVARNITVGSSNTATTGVYTLGNNTTNTAAFSGTATLNQGLTVTQASNGTLNVSGGITSGASGTQTLTFNNAGTVNASGVIGGGTGTIAVAQAGAGTTTLSGSNNYTGPTTVSAGKLEIAGSLTGTTQVDVTGGTLLLSGGSERVNDSAAVSMSVAGSTIAFDNALSNATETLSSLTLTANSILDFGSGSGNRLLFSGAISGLSSNTLSIYNWSGPVGNAAQDVLAYGSTLSLGERNNVSFYSGAIGTEATTFLGTGNQIDFGSPDFQVVPVPEPSSTAMLGSAVLLGLIGFRERRRLRRTLGAMRTPAGR